MAAVKVAVALIFIVFSLNVLFTASSSLPITSNSVAVKDGNKGRILFGRKLKIDLDELVQKIKSGFTSFHSDRGVQDENKGRMLFDRKLKIDQDELMHNVKLSGGRGSFGGGRGSSGSRGIGSSRGVYGGTGARRCTGCLCHRSGGVHRHTSNLVMLTAAIFFSILFWVSRLKHKCT